MRPSPGRVIGVLLGGGGPALGMDPAVVVGQGLAECAGPAGHRALADLAAGDRELGDGGPAPARERTTRGMSGCRSWNRSAYRSKLA